MRCLILPGVSFRLPGKGKTLTVIEPDRLHSSAALKKDEGHFDNVEEADLPSAAELEDTVLTTKYIWVGMTTPKPEQINSRTLSMTKRASG